MGEKRSTGPIQTGQNGVGGRDSNHAPAHFPVPSDVWVQMHTVVGHLDTWLFVVDGPGDPCRTLIAKAKERAAAIRDRMVIDGSVPAALPHDAVFTMMEAHALLDRLLGAGLIAYSSKAEALRIRGELKKFFPQTISNDDGGNDAA